MFFGNVKEIESAFHAIPFYLIKINWKDMVKYEHANALDNELLK
jgi:hypothetical protein